MLGWGLRVRPAITACWIASARSCSSAAAASAPNAAKPAASPASPESAASSQASSPASDGSAPAPESLTLEARVSSLEALFAAQQKKLVEVEELAKKKGGVM